MIELFDSRKCEQHFAKSKHTNNKPNQTKNKTPRILFSLELLAINTVVKDKLKSTQKTIQQKSKTHTRPIPFENFKVKRC